FYPGENFSGYFHQSTNTHKPMATVDEYLHAGYGTTIGVHTGEFGHVVTVWGVEYNADYDPDDMASAQYSGIWITDSDDSKTLASPPDLLRHVDLHYPPVTGWYLTDYYGRSDWRITSVQGLAQTPEPATLGMMMFGFIALLSRRRRAA
ncbi:MAG: PEP-CTERM sorting domain-containing protein, partial [Planctomycetes bacterium]|nr:PEP-CTERM sorting domain-containing protein [Planctomycetota bacterium]